MTAPGCSKLKLYMPPRFKGWSLTSVAAYFSTPKSFVTQTMKDFGFKLQWKKTWRRCIKEKHKKISAKHIELIREYMENNKGNHITVDDI